ncbi:hypothetical protein WG66_005546 [Moniliophthora roreri]|nr:hypothetical protein WG66_005546 [Moniliophthora roreri]
MEGSEMNHRSARGRRLAHQTLTPSQAPYGVICPVESIEAILPSFRSCSQGQHMIGVKDWWAGLAQHFLIDAGKGIAAIMALVQYRSGLEEIYL